MLKTMRVRPLSSGGRERSASNPGSNEGVEDYDREALPAFSPSDGAGEAARQEVDQVDLLECTKWFYVPMRVLRYTRKLQQLYKRHS